MADILVICVCTAIACCALLLRSFLLLSTILADWRDGLVRRGLVRSWGRLGRLGWLAGWRAGLLLKYKPNYRQCGAGAFGQCKYILQCTCKQTMLVHFLGHWQLCSSAMLLHCYTDNIHLAASLLEPQQLEYGAEPLLQVWVRDTA
jgi:hypothetical protein